MIKRAVKIAALLIAFVGITAASAYLALTLIIQSEETVIVPELVGREVVYALELLTGLELDIKVNGFEYSSSVAKHHVIFQQPAAGAEIKKGRDVKIILSKGPETVNLPNFMGVSFQQAGVVLQDEGLCAGTVSRSYHPVVEIDYVIAQYPFAGRAMARRQCVDLLVSKGRRPEAFLMPQLGGLPIDQAILLLELEKLRIDRIDSRAEQKLDPDIVLAQNPAAGAFVTRATPIQLVVNRTTPGSSFSAGGTAGHMQLFRHQTGSGYLRKHVRIEVGTGGGVDVLFDDFARPNSEIWLAIPADRSNDVFVYENDQLVQGGTVSVWQSGFRVALF